MSEREDGRPEADGYCEGCGLPDELYACEDEDGNKVKLCWKCREKYAQD